MEPATSHTGSAFLACWTGAFLLSPDKKITRVTGFPLDIFTIHNDHALHKARLGVDASSFATPTSIVSTVLVKEERLESARTWNH